VTTAINSIKEIRTSRRVVFVLKVFCLACGYLGFHLLSLHRHFFKKCWAFSDWDPGGLNRGCITHRRLILPPGGRLGCRLRAHAVIQAEHERAAVLAEQ